MPPAGERQPAGAAPQPQVPNILVLLGFHARPRQRDPVGGEGEEPPHRGPRPCVFDGLGDADELAMTAQVIDHVPQRGGHDPSPLGQRRLHAVEQFGDHARLESAEGHPAAAITKTRCRGTTKPGKIR